MKKEVLGIKIHDISSSEAVETIFGWLKKGGPASTTPVSTRSIRGGQRGEKHYVVTANPEIIMMAQKDTELKSIINNADLVVPDGVGLKLTTDIVCYTPGVDLMEEIIKSSLDYGFTIGLLGGDKGIAEKTADCLRKKYPKVKISFVGDGGKINQDGQMIPSTTNYQLPTTDLLFVAFGPPKQEKWISKNLKELPVKVAMGVGGSFDFLSGSVPRAPKFIRKLGLEWLFRLIIQPWRIKRQLALIKYLLMVL